MYREYKQAVLNELIGKKYAITNPDIDGLLSLAIVQKYYPEIEFGGWYTNQNLFVAGEGKWTEYVGLDISFSHQFPIASISNHVEVNCTGVSCNKHITEINYYGKSLFNTSLLLLASIDKNYIENVMTDHQIRMLLTADSVYLGYFDYGGRYRHNIVGYLKAYGLERVIEVLENSTFEQFALLKREYETKEIGTISHFPTKKIIVDSRFERFFEDIGITAPEIHDNFTKSVYGQVKKGYLQEYLVDEKSNAYSILSNAMTGKNFLKWTIWGKDSVVQIKQK